MDTTPLIWLRADYHLPALYSCRVPMTSITSARALPAPGPATVRLALIRTAIEVFGISYTTSVLFPRICALPLALRPPERVALTPQMLRVYKVDTHTQHSIETPSSRDMAHAQGPLSLYLQVPLSMRDTFRQVLQMIGSWGQASSLAWCSSIHDHQPPSPNECAIPLRLFSPHLPLQPFFSSLLSEFRDPHLQWHDVIPLLDNTSKSPLQLDIYLWPLVEVFHHGSGQLLQRRPFPLSYHAHPSYTYPPPS